MRSGSLKFGWELQSRSSDVFCQCVSIYGIVNEVSTIGMLEVKTHAIADKNSFLPQLVTLSCLGQIS
jgi:hypothetical protein